MNFASDNSYGAHPAVMQALVDCNDGAVMGYGADPVTDAAIGVLGDLFDAPDAVIRFVTTGTAANALVCAQLAPSFGRIYCHRDAHIETSECAAPEFFSNGAKLIALPGTDGKLTPGILADALAEGAMGGLGDGRNALVSLTNSTESGTIYSVADLTALAGLTRDAGLRLHLDGARFANAAAGLNASPAQMTHLAGVDALCLGGTKNGALAAEAVMIFDPALADGLAYRQKQSGHVLSKNRFVAAQMLALFQDGLWLDLARHANAAAAELGQGLRAAGVDLIFPVQSNAVFAALPAAVHQRLRAAGVLFHDWPDDAVAPGHIGVRLVTSWETGEDQIAALLALVTG